MQFIKLLSILLFSGIFSGILNGVEKDSETNYKPHLVSVKGQLISLNNKPIKWTKIYCNSRKFDQINRHETWTDSDKSNFKGQFLFRTWIDKNNLELWIETDNYAQVQLKNLTIDTNQFTDTIDLGDIYLASYDDERKVEYFNMKPSNKKKTPAKIKITAIDSILSSNACLYKMKMSSVDTTEMSIRRLNFGPSKPRGTIIESYKTTWLIKDYQSTDCD